MPFDASKFVNQDFTGANATRYNNCPEGDYTLKVDLRESDVAKWIRENEIRKGPRAGSMMVSLDVPVEVLDDGVRAKLNQEHVYTRYSCILDFDKNGDLDFAEGRNVKLGRLREAMGQNTPGQAWNVKMLANDTIVFKGHVIERPDPNNPEDKFSEVSRVTKV